MTRHAETAAADHTHRPGSRRLAGIAIVALLLFGVPACSPSAEGRVLDTDGIPQPGCVVGACQLFDSSGTRVSDPTPVLTRSGPDGNWSLSGLASGINLVFAWQPSPDEAMPSAAELTALAKSLALGTPPATGRSARCLMMAESRTRMMGVDLELGLRTGEGFHFMGKVSGPILADRLTYVVTASVMRGELRGAEEDGFTYSGSGGRLMWTTDFVATTDRSGAFDCGWILGGDLVNVSVSAVPSGCTQLAQLSMPVARDETIDIPVEAHAIVDVQVLGGDAEAQRLGRRAIRYWEPGRSSGSVAVSSDGRASVIVQAGGTLLQAWASGYASAFAAMRPGAGSSSGTVSLELVPESHTEIVLVDESGKPIPGAWTYIGIQASATFSDPRPLFSVSDERGKLSLTSLPRGTYPAEIVHEPGSYDEWRVDFEIEVTGSENVITVPLAEKKLTYDRSAPR